MATRTSTAIAGLVLLAAILVPQTAAAHKLNVFAYVDGTTIRGNAYFQGSNPARNVRITAVDPAGHELARTTTNERGEFAFGARQRSDYKLIADTGDGHGAEFTVRRAELPETLPASAATANGAESPSPIEPAPKITAAPDRPIQVEIHALSAQIVELRQQIAEHESRTRFRDILGGLGFIAGLAGVACYFAAKRSRTKMTP